MAGMNLSGPLSRLDYAGASVVINADGSITMTPLAGKNLTLGSGQLLAPDGAVGTPALSFSADSDTGIWRGASGDLRFDLNGTDRMRLLGNALVMDPGWAVSWGSSGVTGPDVLLYRDSAGTLALRNATNNQAFRVFETYTDTNNYSCGRLRMGNTGFLIGTYAVGSPPLREAILISTELSGQELGIKTKTELTTIAAAASTATTMTIPANAIVLAVSVRVTVAIPTAATFTVTGATSATQFDAAGGVSVALNTTDVGTRSCPYLNTAAQAIRITPNVQPADTTGRVRITIHYLEITPATS